MSDRGRHRDPQPLNRQGELALVVLAGVIYVLGWAAIAGLGLAAAAFGGGWFVPGGDRSVAVLIGLLSGHPGRGLPADLAARVPGPVAVYTCVGLVETVVVVAAIGMGVLIARYRRPGDARRGMATRREAAQVLGLRRLRAARAVIRPDLGALGIWWRRTGSPPVLPPVGEHDAKASS
jgi:hypothetical protein